MSLKRLFYSYFLLFEAYAAQVAMPVIVLKKNAEKNPEKWTD